MKHQHLHIPEKDLQLSASGELSPHRTAEVRDQIPDRMSKEDGEKFGGMIGECAATRAEIQLAGEAKRRNDPRCSDPTAWTKGF